MAVRSDSQLVIEASSVGTPNVYFVGPYGARVSFASQQRRVLNLIWSLREAGKWPKVHQPRIAVIGGGIAGVMAAAALRLQDCSVWLFEKGDSELELQRDARHRFVHPSINFWPEQPLSWTTTFPFLDWYAGSSDQIIRTITRQWNACFRDAIANLVYDRELVSFEAGRGVYAGKVKLLFKGVTKPEYADAVFVTTGYGPERTLGDPKFRSYWEPDDVDRWSRSNKARLAVSGTGDGGLIDALRLAYEGFMTKELALQFLLKIDPPRDHGAAARDSAVSSRVKEIEAQAEAIDDENKRAAFYDAKYTDFVEDQDAAAKNLLPWSEGRPPIQLFGELPKPYSGTSAPVHKILMALSIAWKRVVYVQGKVSQDPKTGKYWVTRPGKAPQQIEADHVVVRHGAVPPIAHLLDPDDLAALTARQRQLGDYLHLSGFDEAKYFAGSSFSPGRATDFKGFRHLRSEMAREFLRDRFNVGMREPVNAGWFGFEVIDDRSADEVKRHAFGPVPASLFGIEVRHANDEGVPVDTLVGWRR